MAKFKPPAWLPCVDVGFNSIDSSGMAVIDMAIPLLTAGTNINPATRINADTAVAICTFDDFLINLTESTH
jgi:hypothetical protein